MTWETITVLLTSTGFLAGIAVIMRTILDHRRGVRSTEIEVSAQQFLRMQEEIERLTATIFRVEGENMKKDIVIGELVAHINNGGGPPAPLHSVYRIDMNDENRSTGHE